MTLCRPGPRGTQRLKGGFHCDRRGGENPARTFMPVPVELDLTVPWINALSILR
ncbi:hypothetical protein BDV39DRAFT_183897 [Aspergillus sergii]|uniref:Uncharacterized protein n=1 Tax=Aspergillus sergii TaxID=1034303 RepID=A0A5N6WRI9_9EURO|nr:hypothetical protein BDV39DRAFT_183897 [Aspergillus sergii]